MKFFRALYIFGVAIQFGLDEFASSNRFLRGLRLLIRTVFFKRNLSSPRGARLRLALQKLGPIFVKFGQVLSTRRDMIPLDIADQLALLQDRVEPFPSKRVSEIIDQSFAGGIPNVFREFDLVRFAIITLPILIHRKVCTPTQQVMYDSQINYRINNNIL